MKKFPNSALAFIGWLSFFTLLPFLLILGMSFLQKGEYGGYRLALTFENYLRCFDLIYAKVLLKTIWLAIMATGTCLLVGFPVAYYLARSRGAMKQAGLILLFIPFWTNFLVRISAWIMIMGRSGVINSLLQAFGIIDRPIDMIPSLGAELVGMVYAFLPAAVFPIYAALASIDKSLVEAAEDLGCNRLATHRRVTIPLASTGIWAAGLFVFIPCLGVFVIPVLLGGGKDLLLGNLIVTLALEFRNIPFASAVAIVALVFVTIGLAWYLRVSSIAASRTG